MFRSTKLAFAADFSVKRENERVNFVHPKTFVASDR